MFVVVVALIAFLILTTHRDGGQSLVIVAGALVLFAALVKLNISFTPDAVAHPAAISAIVLSLMLVGQIAASYYFRLDVESPGWDFNVIAQEAIRLAHGGPQALNEYFLSFPHNILTVLYLAVVFKLFGYLGFSDYNLIGIGLNIVSIDSALILGYFVVRKLTGNAVALVYAILCMLFSPFYFYAPVFYTDTLPLFIPVAMLYLYVVYRRTGLFRYWVGISLLAFVGFSFKATIVLVLVAMVIDCFLSVGTRRASLNLAFSIIVVMAASHLFSLALVRTGLVPGNYEQMSLPKYHWIMMGLRGVGGWNSDDYDFTNSFPDKTSKQRAQLSEIRKRLADYGPIGYLGFLDTKLRYTWADGTYAAINVLSNNSIRHDELRKYVLDYAHNGFYRTFSNVVHLTLFLLLLSGALVTKNGSLADAVEPLRYCVIGLFLFLILWETMARYLVHFLPLMIILASLQMTYVAEFFARRSRRTA